MFYLVFHSFIRFYWVLLSFTKFLWGFNLKSKGKRVLTEFFLGFITFYGVSSRFYLVLLGFIKFFSGFHRVFFLPSLT